MNNLLITFGNSGGELDRRIARTSEEALKLAIEMIAGGGELHDGDKIVVAWTDEEPSED